MNMITCINFVSFESMIPTAFSAVGVVARIIPFFFFFFSLPAPDVRMSIFLLITLSGTLRVCAEERKKGECLEPILIRG